MGKIVLVLGGVRSGKSRFAEQLAALEPSVTYLASAQAGDAEMARRIARHQERRARYGPAWQTVEEPWDVASAVAKHGANSCVLLECATLWLTNLLVGLPGRQALDDGRILEEVIALADAGRQVRGPVIIVSNEAGWGIMPDNALARRFGDLLGEANQRLAAAATNVYACIAGLPLRIKQERTAGRQTEGFTP